MSSLRQRNRFPFSRRLSLSPDRARRARGGGKHDPQVRLAAFGRPVFNRDSGIRPDRRSNTDTDKQRPADAGRDRRRGDPGPGERAAAGGHRRHRHHRDAPQPGAVRRADGRQRRHRAAAPIYRRDRHPAAQPGLAVAARLLDHVRSGRAPSRASAASARSATTPASKARSASSSTASIAPRAGMALTDLGPLDRIEVLRGPQGTLFGRNTSAGLISIITAKPRFTPGSRAGRSTSAITITARAQASVTGPLSDTIAARLDAVWVKRDGFLKDVISGRDVNDRDRWLTARAGAVPAERRFLVPADRRLSRTNEECCGAVYLPTQDVIATGGGGFTTGRRRSPRSSAASARPSSTIPYRREDRRSRPGRNYDSRRQGLGPFRRRRLRLRLGRADLDHRLPLQQIYARHGCRLQQSRHPVSRRRRRLVNRFKTFSQELRLQGNALRQPPRLAGRRLLREREAAGRRQLQPTAPITTATPIAWSPRISRRRRSAGASRAGRTPTCFNPIVATARSLPLRSARTRSRARRHSRRRLPINIPGRRRRSVNFGAPPFSNSGFSNIATLLGSPGLSLGGTGLNDLYNQTSNNWALFTHNIFSITDQLKLTVGARYTHETKNARRRPHRQYARSATSISASPFAALQQLPCVLAEHSRAEPRHQRQASRRTSSRARRC